MNPENGKEKKDRNTYTVGGVDVLDVVPLQLLITSVLHGTLAQKGRIVMVW